MSVYEAHMEIVVFFQSTVNDLNVHKATKEEQVISPWNLVKLDLYQPL